MGAHFFFPVNYKNRFYPLLDKILKSKKCFKRASFISVLLSCLLRGILPFPRPHLLLSSKLVFSALAKKSESRGSTALPTWIFFIPEILAHSRSHLRKFWMGSGSTCASQPHLRIIWKSREGRSEGHWNRRQYVHVSGRPRALPPWSRARQGQVSTSCVQPNGKSFSSRVMIKLQQGRLS